MIGYFDCQMPGVGYIHLSTYLKLVCELRAWMTKEKNEDCLKI